MLLPLRCTLLARWSCLLGTLAILAGCDRQNLTEPDHGPDGIDPSFATGARWVGLGEYQVPVPSTNWGIPTGVWESTGVTITQRSDIRVTVSGSVTLEDNAGFWNLCAEFGVSCWLNLPGGTVLGPLGVSPGDSTSKYAVRVRVRRPDGTIQPLRLFSTTPSSVIGQLRVDPGVVEVSRNPDSCGFYGGGSAPCYNLSGSQIVRIEQFQIQEQANLTLECSAAGVVSRTTTAEPQSIALERGGEISCKAVAQPSGTVDVVGWQFAGENFTYPDVAAGDMEVTDPEWGGTIATSGTITVRAKINGSSETSRAMKVGVTPRPAFRDKRVPITTVRF